MATYPSIGAALYVLACESGLVTSNSGDRETQILYEKLKRSRTEKASCPSNLELECIQTVMDRIEALLPKAADDVLGTFGHLLENYDRLKDQVAVDCLAQPTLADDLLWPHLFAPAAGEALHQLKRAYGDLIDLDSLLKAPRPYADAINQLTAGAGTSFGRIAVLLAGTNPGKVDDEKKNLRRWRTGTLPTEAQQNRLIKAIGLGDERVRAWLMASRLLSVLPPNIRSLIAPLTDGKQQAIVDLGSIIFRCNAEAGAPMLSTPVRASFEKLQRAVFHLRRVHRRSGDRQGVAQTLTDFDLQVAALPAAQAMRHWAWGRFHLLCREFDQSIDRYERACEASHGSGPDEDRIRFELVLVATLAGRIPICDKHWMKLRFTYRTPPHNLAQRSHWLLNEINEHFPFNAYFPD